MVIISSDDSILISKPDTCDYDVRVNPALLDFSLYTLNSSSITLTGNGLLNSKLQASLKLSTNPDNIISVDGTGLLALAPVIPASTDEFVKASSSDTTAGTLQSKLIVGSGLSITVLNPGGNEQLRINNTQNSLDSVTTSGTSGAATFNAGVLNIPVYNLAGLGGITLTDLSASTPLAYNNTTGVFSITQASTSTAGYLSNTDWNTFNGKQSPITPAALTKTDDTNVTLTLGGTPATSLLQSVSLTLGWTGTLADGRIASASTWNAKQDALSGTGIVKSTAGTISYITDNSANWDTAYTNRITTLTTTGTSGAATLVGNTLNIPQYSAGTGTVTSVSVVSANGFGGSVATDTTTPAITITTSVIGLLKGDGTGVSAATAGTDFQIPITVSNGMTYSGGAVTLGGSLTGNTTITGGTYYMAFLGSIGTLNQSNTPFSAASTITTTGTETAQYIMSGVSGALVVNNASTFTPYSSSKHGSVSGSVYKDSAGNWAGPLNAIYGCVQVAGTGDVTTTVAIRAYKADLTSGRTFGGTITNAVGVYIDDISTSSVSASITNRYAIYQEGASDINLLNGILRMVNLPVYADNSAASSLPPGTFYRTATGTVMIRY